MRRLEKKTPQTETDPIRSSAGRRLITVTAALSLLATMCAVSLMGVALLQALRVVARVDNWIIWRLTIFQSNRVSFVIALQYALFTRAVVHINKSK